MQLLCFARIRDERHGPYKDGHYSWRPGKAAHRSQGSSLPMGCEGRPGAVGSLAMLWVEGVRRMVELSDENPIARSTDPPTFV